MASTQLATTEQPQRVSPLVALASRFNSEPARLLQTLKDTVFKNASDSELMALCIVANEYGLNPLTKEIYAFPAKGGGIVPVVSVDGWIRIINSHPQMDGLEFEWNNAANGDPISCTAIIHRKDRTRPIKVTEYFSECVRATDPWKMKHRMLRHKALIQGGRVAFGFGGVFDEDEAHDIKQAVATEIKPPVFAAAATLALPAQEQTGEAGASSPAQEKRGPASKCTPRQALANLMQHSHVKDADMLAFLKTQDAGEFTALADVDEQLISHLVSTWADIVDRIERSF